MKDLIDVLRPSDDDGEFRVPWPIAGVVTNVDDSLGAVRIKARIEGMAEREESDWIMPMLPGSLECKPNKDDPCIIFFVHGDPNRPLWCATVDSKTKKRPTEEMMLGSAMAAMYMDLATKFNTLLSNYQAFYTAVQGHVHASFGTPSASLLEATIGPTCHNTDAATGKPKIANGSLASAKSSNEIVLSGKCKLRGSGDET